MKKIPPGFQPGWLPCPCGQVHPVPTPETLEKFTASQLRVPWGKNSAGQDVYTNGIKEDALGLSPFITGWGGDHGYYVPNPHNAAIVAEIIASIDWDRVCEVDAVFDIPFNHDDRPGMMFDRRLLVTPKRYDELHRACFRAVPREQFDVLVESTLKRRRKP